MQPLRAWRILFKFPRGDGRIYIRFQNNLFFAPDSAAILADAYPLLDFLGDCLNAVDDEILLVNINGHTAAVPNGETYQVSDWMLSSERKQYCDLS